MIFLYIILTKQSNITPKLGVQLFKGCIYTRTHTYMDTKEWFRTEGSSCLPLIWPEFELGHHGNSASSRTSIATYVPISLANYLLIYLYRHSQYSKHMDRKYLPCSRMVIAFDMNPNVAGYMLHGVFGFDYFSTIPIYHQPKMNTTYILAHHTHPPTHTTKSNNIAPTPSFQSFIVAFSNS